VVQKKNDRRSVVVVGTWLRWRWWRWLCIYELLYVYLLFVSVFLTSVVVVVEIGGDTSPEYRCRYGVVDNLDGLTIDEVVAVFSHGRVLCIPFFEIDVNIVIVYLVCIVGGGGCYPLPFRKSELSRFYDDFVDFTQPSFIDNGREFFMGDFA
jgi:hypothetical protein